MHRAYLSYFLPVHQRSNPKWAVKGAKVIADDDLIAHKDVLAQGAAFAYSGTGADVDPVPDAGAITNLCAIVNDGSFMDVG